MTTKNKDGSSRKETDRKAAPSPVSRRLRKHGYGGYPLTKGAGGVHTGRGFAGVEPLGGGDVTLPRAGVFTEDSTRGAPEEPEDQPRKH